MAMDEVDFTKPEGLLLFLSVYTRDFVNAQQEVNAENAKAVASLVKAAVDAHYVMMGKAQEDKDQQKHGWRMKFGKVV